MTKHNPTERVSISRFHIAVFGLILYLTNAISPAKSLWYGIDTDPMRIGHLPNPTGLCVLKKILQFTWREISELRSECGIRDASHIRSSGVWWGAIYTPHSRHKKDVNCCRATYMQYLFPVQSTNITLSNLHQVGRQVNGLSQLEAHCSRSALMCSANRDFLENLWHAFDRREGTQRV